MDRENSSQMIKLGPGASVRLWIKCQVPRRPSQDSHPNWGPWPLTASRTCNPEFLSQEGQLFECWTQAHNTLTETMTGFEESLSLFSLSRCEEKFLIEGEKTTQGNQEALDSSKSENVKSNDNRMEYWYQLTFMECLSGAAFWVEHLTLL